MAQTADLPPLTTDLIVVKDHASYGRSAYASQAIKAGSIVICEDPLLSHQHSNENKVLLGMMKKLEQYIKSHPEIEGKASRVHLDDWAKACGFWLSFCRASNEVQQQILQDMFNSPEGDSVDSAAPMLRTAVQAEVLSGMSEEFTKILKIFAAVAAGGSAGTSEVKPASSDPELIRKVLLAAELNVHQMGASGVIYAQGSKLAHVCDSPNTTYMSFKGRGCFIATRDIAAGEVLTTTYLPDDMQMMSVFARRRYLWDTFCFKCACPRCTSQLDKFSSLPCNRCATAATTRKEDGILPQTFITGAGASNTDGSSSSSTDPPCGLLQFDPRKADPAALREHYVHDHKHDHDDCCGCGHDHDHEHHHHDHDHDHKHKAADKAGGDAAAADSAAAGAAAAAAVFTPWQCTKCGLQLPDDDTELVGDYKVIRDAHARVEDWAYSVAMNFNPQSEDSQRHLNMLLSLVGPYHWAVHLAWGRQTEYFAAVLRTLNQQIMQQQQGRASAQQLEYLASSVKGIRLNVNRTWSWLTGVVGMSTEAASKHLTVNLVPVAAVLLHVSSHMRMVPKLSAHHGDLIKEMQDLSADLFAKAEPTLQQLRGWPLPEPHPLVRQAEQAQSFAAKAAEAAAANGAAAAAAGGALSMDKLQEFLPAESAKAASTGPKASAAGSSKAKGKKKTAGKK